MECILEPVIQSLSRNGEMGLAAWWALRRLSQWGPLVILAPRSSPPWAGWWRCRQAAGHPGPPGAPCWQQPGWRKAGGSPCAGRGGSAGGS